MIHGLPVDRVVTITGSQVYLDINFTSPFIHYTIILIDLISYKSLNGYLQKILELISGVLEKLLK